MKAALLLILAIGSINSSSAAEQQEIARCAAINSDGERLICFDSLSRELGVDRPTTQISAGEGKWRSRIDVSPIDDSTNVVLTLQSEAEIRSGYNSSRPRLVLRCAQGTTNVFIQWDLYLGLDSTSMLTRLDSEEATTATWLISTNNQSVFVRGSDIEYAKTLLQHSKLLAQITPYGENSVMATFDLQGLSSVIGPLREACSW